MAAARKLFDAAVVVDETHACAWHKWGMLERAEGNYMRARDLWMQGIQKCRKKPQNQNAYLYNALAVMAAQVSSIFAQHPSITFTDIIVFCISGGPGGGGQSMV